MSIKRFKRTVNMEEAERIARSPLTQRTTRFYLLRHDDTVLKEITDWVVPGGNIEKNNNSGQTRTTSLTLRNEKVVNTIGYKNGIPIKEEQYLWTPSPNKGGLWDYNKIKIETQLFLDNEIFEIDEGIFVLHDPNLKLNNAENQVTMQCYDKFALLDGTVDGIGDMDYEIPVNSKLFEACEGLLHLSRYNGIPFDLNPISFPVKYKDILTAYTIKKTSENAIGSILLDLTKMISCDVKYNDIGNLVVTDSLEDLDYHNRTVSWSFQENEYKNPSMQVNRSKIKNKVTVMGSNINGIVCRGVAENTNPASNFNIRSSFGVRPVKVTDDLIYSDFLCQERARYELKKYAQKYATLKFTSNYIPHLEPGDIVRWTYKPWEIEQEEFLVNSISVPLDGKGFMSLSCTNLKELPL